MGTIRYLEPNRKAQITLAAIIVCAAVMFIGIKLFVDSIMPSEDASIKELESAAKLLEALALGTNAIGIIVSLVVAAYFGRLGYRALKTGNFPPLGTIVVRRTMIHTGKKAYIAGSLSIVFALAVVSSGAFVAYVMSIMIAN